MAVNGTSCRPPYEERSARISILANGIAAKAGYVCADCSCQLQKPLADGAGHTFSARCRAMRFHVRGVDHLCVCGSSVSSKLPEQVFPDATPRPTHKAIIDSCRRSIVLGRTIAPATAAFQNMHDAADDAAVVRPLDDPYIRRQMRFDPSPLLVAQPKQVPAHNPDPLPTTNQDRIVRAKKLMSSDPSPGVSLAGRCHGNLAETRSCSQVTQPPPSAIAPSRVPGSSRGSAGSHVVQAVGEGNVDPG